MDEASAVVGCKVVNCTEEAGQDDQRIENDFCIPRRFPEGAEDSPRDKQNCRQAVQYRKRHAKKCQIHAVVAQFRDQKRIPADRAQFGIDRRMHPEDRTGVRIVEDQERHKHKQRADGESGSAFPRETRDSQSEHDCRRQDEPFLAEQSGDPAGDSGAEEKQQLLPGIRPFERKPDPKGGEECGCRGLQNHTGIEQKRRAEGAEQHDA